MTGNPRVDAHRKRLKKGRPKGGEVYVVGYSIIWGVGIQCIRAHTTTVHMRDQQNIGITD